MLSFSVTVAFTSRDSRPLASRRRMLKTQLGQTIAKPVSNRPAHRSDINQPALRRDRDRFSSANRIQLFQNSLYVCLHRVLTDVTDLTDLFIALAETHLLENLQGRAPARPQENHLI